MKNGDLYLNIKGNFHVSFKRLSNVKPMTLSYVPLEVTKLCKTFFSEMLCFRDINL